MNTNILENKEAIKETTIHPMEKNGNVHESVESTADLVDSIVGLDLALEEGGSKFFEVIGEAATGKSGSATGTQSTTKKQQIKQKIEEVKKFSKPQLAHGIEKELKHEIKELKKEARKAKSIGTFSAYELNKCIRGIRNLKEQLAQLVTLAIDKLRELYITLVLGLKLVAV